jgi:DNA polymerase-1
LPVRPKLLIVDGHSLAYRAFHALPVDKFHSPQGIPVNAVYGLCSMIVNLLAEHKPTHLAVCFDEGRNTFRKQVYSQYKANRAASPDEFRVQVSLIRGLIDSLGIVSYSDAQFEADDLIATIATEASAADMEVLVVTSDRDSFQLISDTVNILYPKKGLSEVVRMDASALFEKYGLTPSQYADFAALRGDPSDNLPGIPGVGEKTATTWIQKYGSLKSLIENSAEVAGKVGESLRNNLEVVETNAHLTKLVNNVAIDASPQVLMWKPEMGQGVVAFATELGFKSLIPRLKNLVGETTHSESIDLPLETIASLLVNHSAVALYRDGKLSVMDFEDGKALNSILDNALTMGSVAVSDLKQIAKVFLEFGGRLNEKQASHLIDVVVIEYLINPGSRPQVEDLLVESGSDQLFSNKVDQEQLCRNISASFHQLSGHDSFSQALELYQNLEAKVSLVLAEMEHNGIAIDLPGLTSMIAAKTNEQLELETQGHGIHGREFNFGSPKQLQDVLFTERGLTKTKKTKTGFTTDSDALDFLISKHPDDELLPIIKSWRETSKIKQMLVSLNDALKDRRIHTTFMQTIAATGRLSSTKPNLQNVPVRTEAGRAIRGLFVSEEPYGQLITADYSQIELRVMAHLASDKALIEAFKSGEDLHVSVAAQIYGIKPSEVTSEIRNQIKAVSYGLAYGLSAYGLSQGLRIDVSEADLLMNKFFERFAGVRNYLRESVEVARQNGYTETILGRRRYFPELNHENRFRREVAERAALNAPIQGSAADIIKLAMVQLNEKLIQSGYEARLLLQVHDELVLESSKRDLEMVVELTKTTMEKVIELAVPLDVSVGVGKNWLTAAH